MKRIIGFAGILTVATILLAGCRTTSDSPVSAADRNPDVGQPAVEAPAGQITVFVSSDNRVQLNGKKVSAKNLAKRLQKLGVKPDAPIQIHAAPTSRFNAVLDVLQRLKDSGYTHVSMKETTQAGSAAR